MVKEVQDRKITVHVVEAESLVSKGWELDVVVHLEEGLSDPRVGGKYIFKGTLDPFERDFKDVNFRAEVCEEVGENAET